MPAFAPFVTRHRMWVLAAATLVGMIAAGVLDRPAPREPAPAFLTAGLIPTVHAAPGVTVIRIAANDASAPKAPAVVEQPATAESADPPAQGGKAKKKPRAEFGINIDEDTGNVRVTGVDGSREFDSFEAFVEQAPWVAALVFGVTFLVFLTPILIIALVIWYKMRRTRMVNETMLKLAERGVVPAGEALEAVAAGNASAYQASPTTAPLYEHAKSVRKRVAWSDLRKGVVMGAVGLGLVFYSMLDAGEPNGLGLVLLFVGLGYIVLWYFEDRQSDVLRDAAQSLPRSPPPPPPAA